MQTIQIEKLNLTEDDRILDLGCGDGRHLHHVLFESNAQSIGVDISIERVLESRESCASFSESGQKDQISFARTDALELPFPDQSFDVIICSEVLEHLHRYQPAIDEIDRILKPGGRLGISVPKYGPEKLCWMLSDEYHHTDGGHVRIFESTELLEPIESKGFNCVESHSAHALHSPLWWLKCLFWEQKDESVLIETYENFLEWELVNEPFYTRWIERLLNPLIGKSSVYYFVKEF